MRVVSFNVCHDSSVCSYVDGKIEFYCKEERLSRIKRDKEPYKTLELFYEQKFGPIDKFIYLTPSDDSPDDFQFSSVYIRKKFGVKLENSPFTHHECHASVAFYNSGFEEALVFVIDRNGSICFGNNKEKLARESESVFKCSYPSIFEPIHKSFWIFDENKKYEIKKSLDHYYGLDVNVNNPFSIVKVYEAATSLIGQNALENGKTMGLSSYGEDLNYPSLFINGSPIRNYFSSIDLPYSEEDSSCFYGYEDRITRDLNKDNYQFYANKSKHVQLETQKESLRLIQKYVEITGIKNVCIVGGYGLNVVANNFYIKNSKDVKFYFEPLSDDSGITIGASMLKYRIETNDDQIRIQENNFYHFYKDSSEDLFGSKKNKQDLIEILKDQKILAIFDGSPEAGPRALGHRSLIFDPRNKNGKDIVNILKKREWYRPFAGIILEDQFERYFYTLGLKQSRYMTINFECKPDTKDYVPSIVHVDNTCRIQTVSKSDGFIFDLLSTFYEQTGCPMLLNTSFNLAGDPLVHSKTDALNFARKVSGEKVFSGVYFVQEETLTSF